MSVRIAAVLVALAAIVGANALLLVYGTSRNDPVGRLSPIAHVPLVTTKEPTQAPVAPALLPRREDD